jgi:hypothetical protein
MYIRKALHLLGIVTASSALVTMMVSASGISSFAQGEQNFTANMTDKEEEVVGVHSPEFESEKNIDSVKDADQRSGIAYPAVANGMVKNHTMTTIKLNTTKFQEINKSQF